MPADLGSSKPFYQGEIAKYYQASMESLELLDRQALTAADNAMAALGFSILGDLICSAAPDMIVRGYGRPGATALGFHVQSESAAPYSEFYSEFDDRSSLTTTNTTPSTDYTAHKIYRAILPGSSIDGLLRAHLEGVQAFAAKRNSAVLKWSAELRSPAEAIESFLVRASSPPPAM